MDETREGRIVGKISKEIFGVIARQFVELLQLKPRSGTRTLISTIPEKACRVSSLLLEPKRLIEKASQASRAKQRSESCQLL